MRPIADFLTVIYKNRQAFAGFVILIIFACMASFGPMLVHLNTSVQFADRYQLPSAAHWLGTDFAGRDTFQQLVLGSRDVLSIGFYSAVFTLLIGFLVGAVSGFVGGKTDAVLMFVTNLFLTIPQLPILMIIASLVDISSSIAFAAVISFVLWGGLARPIRSQILTLKERDFIVAGRLMRLGTAHIIFKEMMPNIFSYLAITFIGVMQSAVISSIALILIGLVPYSPSNWGMMIQTSFQQTGGLFNQSGYLYYLSPIVCLVLFQMGCIFFANGLDEALNPRLRRR